MSLNSSILSFWKQSIWFGIQSADRLRILLDVAEQSNTA